MTHWLPEVAVGLERRWGGEGSWCFSGRGLETTFSYLNASVPEHVFLLPPPNNTLSTSLSVYLFVSPQLPLFTSTLGLLPSSLLFSPSFHLFLSVSWYFSAEALERSGSESVDQG